MVKCKCGKQFENGRGLFAHQKFHCHGRVVDFEEREREPAGCQDGHTWRLLNSRDQAEYNALAKGCKKICEECEEIE